MRNVEFKPVDILFPLGSSCYQIPPFQRNYQWGIGAAHRLISDIRQAAVSDQPHWIGIGLLGEASVECRSKNNHPAHNCYDILDGQQRFITLRIWLVALADEYHRQERSDMTKYPRDSLTDIQVHSLDTTEWNRLGRRHDILKVQEFPTDSSSNSIGRVYWYFRRLLLVGIDGLMSEDPIEIPTKVADGESLIESWERELDEGQLSPIHSDDLRHLADQTLENITINTLIHEKNRDEDIEVIFETLNSAREELGQFDLFRNFILIRSRKSGGAQKSLYEKYMNPYEKKVNDAKLNIRKRNLDRFLYDFLIGEGMAKDSGTVKSDSVAKLFKKYWSAKELDGWTVETFLKKVLNPSMLTWLSAMNGSPIIHWEEGDIELTETAVRSILRIENLSRGPFTPIVSRLLRDWLLSGPTRKIKDLEKDLFLIETYAARQILAGNALSPLRREMMSACVHFFVENQTIEEWVEQKSPSDDRIRSVLTQSVAEKRSSGKLIDPPSDKWIIRKDIGVRADGRQMRAIFDGLTVFLEGKLTVPIVQPTQRMITSASKISLEHFFPQNSEKWISNLADWGIASQRMTSRLNALGNLSVVPIKVNSAMRNSSLVEKQKKLKKDGVPNWKILKDFMSAEKWTPAEIDKRTVHLTEASLKYWKLPE